MYFNPRIKLVVVGFFLLDFLRRSSNNLHYMNLLLTVPVDVRPTLPPDLRIDFNAATG